MALAEFSRSAAGLKLLAVLLATGSAQSGGLARNTLTNHNIVTVVNAGFSERFIVQVTVTSSSKFDMTAEGLAELAKSGLSGVNACRISSRASNRGSRAALAKHSLCPTRANRVFV